MLLRIIFTIALVILALMPFAGLKAEKMNMSDDLHKKAIDVTTRADKNIEDNNLQNMTEMQKYVTLHDGTEPPFKNKYWDHHEAGIYVDIISGEALFSSTDKFDSGTGWPSFTKPIEKKATKYEEDNKLLMARTEVRSSESDAHLGHVFEDGPVDKGGKRYCINSAALDFVPVAEMEERGYGEYLYLFEDKE